MYIHVRFRTPRNNIAFRIFTHDVRRRAHVGRIQSTDYRVIRVILYSLTRREAPEPTIAESYIDDAIREHAYSKLIIFGGAITFERHARRGFRNAWPGRKSQASALHLCDVALNRWFHLVSSTHSTHRRTVIY